MGEIVQRGPVSCVGRTAYIDYLLQLPNFILPLKNGDSQLHFDQNASGRPHVDGDLILLRAEE